MADKFDLIIDRIDDLKESHGKRLDAIDNNLDIHLCRSDEIERSNEIMKEHFDKRIVKLEEPKIATTFIKKHIWNMILGAGTILGIVLTVVRVINSLGK